MDGGKSAARLDRTIRLGPDKEPDKGRAFRLSSYIPSVRRYGLPERFNRRRTERRLIVGRHRYGLVPSAIATAMDLETSLIEKEFFRVATPETPAGRMEFQTLFMETQEHRGRIAARLAEERERQ